MNWELVLQGIETVAVVVGVAFGLFQLKQFRQERELQASIQLMRPFEVPEMASAMLALYDLPDNLSAEELRTRLGENLDSVLTLGAMFDGIGPLVARGHIPIALYAEFYSGCTAVCWKKLRRYVEEARNAGWGNLYEWFQWLAEKMEERCPLASEIPAFERFRDWQDVEDYERLSAAVLPRA
jgi:hypothetical protein